MMRHAEVDRTRLVARPRCRSAKNARARSDAPPLPIPSKRSSKLRWSQSSNSHTKRRTQIDSVTTTVRTTSITSRHPVPFVVTDGLEQLGHRATGWRPATCTTGRRPSWSMVRKTFMSRLLRRKLIPSATVLGSFARFPCQNRSFGARDHLGGGCPTRSRRRLQPSFAKTPLSQLLARRGRVGTEQLTEVPSHFQRLLATVSSHVCRPGNRPPCDRSSPTAQLFLTVAILTSRSRCCVSERTGRWAGGSVAQSLSPSRTVAG